MTLKFEFEFEDESNNDVLTYEAAADGSNSVLSSVENGIPIIYASQAGMLVLARILAQLSLSKYKPGFHVHIQENFDPDKNDCITLVLTE